MTPALLFSSSSPSAAKVSRADSTGLQACSGSSEQGTELVSLVGTQQAYLDASDPTMAEQSAGAYRTTTTMLIVDSPERLQGSTQADDLLGGNSAVTVKHMLPTFQHPEYHSIPQDEHLLRSEGEENSDDDSDSDHGLTGDDFHHKQAAHFMDVDEYGAASDSDSGWEPGLELVRVHCRNCTGPMINHWCPACGHNSADDLLLVDATGQLTAAADDIDTGIEANTRRMKGAPVAKPIALLYDERMEAHEDSGNDPHPERPDRIRAVMARLNASGLTDACLRVDCPEATFEQLSAVHTPALVQFVKAVTSGEPPPPDYPVALLTPDTYVNSSTYSCARLAAGGAAAVAVKVATGEAGHGAAIVRPPGHHAESNMAMGFCFFNNAAVAARAAQAAGAQRVLILDWDIHHGNGTQHIFEEDPSVLYMSLHRYDNGNFYPGTGAPEEVGYGAGTGFTVNVAWNGGEIRNGDYLCAMNQLLVPIAYEYAPDLIIISAGFDAAEGDPIGGCRVTPECFAHMTSMLKGIAPTVLILEGGYNLSATAASTEACLRVLLGEQPPPLPGLRQASPQGAHGMVRALQMQAQYWASIRPKWDMLLAMKQETRLCTTVVPVGCVPEPPAAILQPAIAAPAGVTRGIPPLASIANSARNKAEQELQKQRTAAKHARAVARKKELLRKIRQRAVEAWWQRHNRLAKARMASMKQRLISEQQSLNDGRS